VFSLRPFVLAAVAVFLALVGHASTCAQTTGCEAPDWSPTVAYQRGDSVTHVSHEWIAKRNSQGVVPGTHTPTWRDLGSCAIEPPPPDDPPPPPPPGDATPIAIFGVWHAGNHYADWALDRDMGEFDQANHWIIDRGDGVPSVNLVVLSFLHPMEVLAMQDPVDGVPPGMTMDVVNYFKSAGIRVMMSIGGVTYIDAWDEALALDAERLAVNAARRSPLTLASASKSTTSGTSAPIWKHLTCSSTPTVRFIPTTRLEPPPPRASPSTSRPAGATCRN
jgi:hypothetical protein